MPLLLVRFILLRSSLSDPTASFGAVDDGGDAHDAAAIV